MRREAGIPTPFPRQWYSDAASGAHRFWESFLHVTDPEPSNFSRPSAGFARRDGWIPARLAPPHIDPVPDPDSSPQCDGDIIDQDLVQDIASSGSDSNLMQISTLVSSAPAVGTRGSEGSSQ
eukprot:9472878-Pyramimonas_sp.AAC.1